MNTILLTGAIRPSWPVQRNDPIVRLADYLCAIRRWLDVSTLEQVIYCDASGCRIPEDVFASDKFESLSFDASEHASKYEAGRAEAESIAFVLNHSRFSFGSFFKCTGRNFVQNFKFIQDEIQKEPASDCRLRQWYRTDWADTRFFWITAEKFRTWIEPRIQDLVGHAYDGHVLESLFFEYLTCSSAFPEPEIVGHSGHLNYVYQEDYRLQEREEAMKTINQFGRHCFLLD